MSDTHEPSQNNQPRRKRSGCLIFVGGFLVFTLIMAGLGGLLEYQGKGELARADELWLKGEKDEATGIYIQELEYVEEADEPEVYKRIITHRHDSGDVESATEHFIKAIEGNINVRFARNDLRRMLADTRRAFEDHKARELAEKQAEERRQAEMLAMQEQLQAEEKSRQKEESQALVQANLDAYLAVLKAADVSVVRQVEVKLSGDIWMATLTVDNLWHMKLYQVRLQDAQSLWETWARIASPDNPDSAHIVIVDLRGNKVGGSRVLAGSLIWVQE